MDCTIRIAKTNALISFTDTAKLICVFVFANAKVRFSHVAAHIDVEADLCHNYSHVVKTDFLMILLI